MQTVDTVIGLQLFQSEKSVYLVSLQRTLRSRLIFLQYVFRGAGSAQGAASRRRPLYPRALAAKIATSWFLRLIPTGFGSGRGCVLASHGPQPASMRAAPAFRERLSDFEATNTGSFSSHGYKIEATKRRPDKAQPPSGAKRRLIRGYCPAALRLAGLWFCRTHRRAAVIAAEGLNQRNIGAKALGLNIQQ